MSLENKKFAALYDPTFFPSYTKKTESMWKESAKENI
jgi:hypothetical protein